MAAILSRNELVRRGINDEINQRLIRLNVTQRALARAIHSSQSMISARLVGKQAWPLDQLMAVASFLGIEFSDLVKEGEKRAQSTLTPSQTGCLDGRVYRLERIKNA